MKPERIQTYAHAATDVQSASEKDVTKERSREQVAEALRIVPIVRTRLREEVLAGHSNLVGDLRLAA